MKTLIYLLTALLLVSSSQATGQCFTTVDVGPDLTICEPGGQVQLQGVITGPSDFFEWTPVDGLSNPNSLSPTASVFSTISYELSSYWLSTVNQIINGDFEAGNTGFTSDYVHSPTNLVPEGTYAIIQSPSLVHSNFPPCDDHTFMDGSGYLMAVNGAGTPNENVWCQTVPVTPGTYYNFSAWVMTIVPIAPAQLQFSVNGELLGGIFTAPNTPCQWVNFNEDWFSGGNTSATICIVNQNTAFFGNDFALDDIAFFEYCKASDTVTIEVIPNSMIDLQEFVCVGECYDIGGIDFCNTGFYSQTIPSANGCDSTVNLELTVLNPLAIIQNPDPLTCYNNFITTLDASFSSSTPYSSYFWTGPNGFTSISQNPVITDPGTYTLTVTESGGGVSCSATASVTVDYFGDFPLASAGPSQWLTCANPAVTLDGSNSSFGDEIIYAWSGPGGYSADTIQPLATLPGVYTLTVTNEQSGCTASDIVLVESDLDSPLVTAFADTITCATGEAVLNAITDTLATEFLWSGPNGFSDTVLLTSAQVPGIYALMVIGANGCPGADTIVVVADSTLPSFSLDGTVLSCAMPSDTISLTNGQGVDSLWWSGPGGFTSSDSITEVSLWGWYSASAMGTNGCVLTDSVFVQPDTSGPILTTQGSVIDCQNSSVTVSASSTDTVVEWAWTGPGGFTGNGQEVQVNQAGTYTVTAIGTNGCSTQAVAQVTPSSELPDLLAEGGVLTCTDPVVTLVAESQDGVSVLWSGPSGYSSSAWSPDVSAPGSYTAQVTGANGCQYDTTVVVEIDTVAPSITLSGGVLTCTQQTVVLDPVITGSAPVSYFWSNTAGFISADSTVTLNQGGTYGLVVTASNGCTGSADVQIEVDTVHPTAQLSAPALTCSTQEVMVSAFVTADIPEFSWSGPGGFSSQNQEPTIQIPGVYTMTVSDSSNGCVSVFPISIEADTLPPAISASGDTLTCSEPIGLLQASISPLPAVWEWSGPSGYIQQGDSAEVIAEGVYTLFVEGVNGCSDSLLVLVVTDTTAPALDVTGDPSTCAQPQPVWTAISDQGASFEWGGSGGFVSEASESALPGPGQYKVSATAPNGCLTELLFEVEADTIAPQVTAMGGELSCDSGSISLIGTTDNPQATILWSGPGGFVAQELNPLVTLPGVYQITVTTANGCQATDTALVMADEDIPDLSLAGDTITCDQTLAQLSGTSTTPGVTFAWSGPGAFQSAQPNPQTAVPGTYSLTVTALNGCTASGQTSVGIDTISPVIQVNSLTLNCLNPSLPIDAVLFSPQNANLQWNGPAGFTSQNLQPVVTVGGTYTLLATASNGCETSQSVQVSVDTTSPVVVLSASGILTCSNPVVDLVASDPGISNYLLEWVGPNGLFAGDALLLQTVEPGNYMCEIVDLSNGCHSAAIISLQQDITPAIAVATAENNGVLTCEFPDIILSGLQSTPQNSIDFNWTSSSGQLVGTQAEILVDSEDSYTLIVEHLTSGCSDTATVQVIVDQVPPDLTIAVPELITCDRPEIQLDATGSSVGSDYEYLWTALSGEILEGATGAEPLIGQPGSYQLRIINTKNGCSDSLSVQVDADTTPPIAVATAIGELNCVTDAVTLSAAGSSAGPQITSQWSVISGQLDGNPLDTEIQALASGRYALTIFQMDNGCTASDTVEVTENEATPTEIALDIQAPYCPGQRGGLSVTAVQGGTPPFLYALNGQVFSPQTDFQDLYPGNYTVTVQDLIGCEDSVTVTIPEPAGPQIFLPGPINMRFSESRQLLPDLNFPESLIDSITWWPPDFLSCTDCLRPYVELPRHTITYRLTILTTEGCTAEEEILVRVNRLRSVFVPNVFSPGDQNGYNDELTVYGPADEIRRITRFLIFDRWGEQVFEARDFAPNDPSAGWNGTFAGKMMTPGVFVYLAEVEFVDGEVVIYEGDVTLMR